MLLIRNNNPGINLAHWFYPSKLLVNYLIDEMSNIPLAFSYLEAQYK